MKIKLYELRRGSLFFLFVLAFHSLLLSQQVAKSIPYPASPDGLIGFLQFTPPDYGTQQHPLIIFLHGIGERGNGTSQINSVANNGTPYYCARGASMRFTANGQTSSFVVLSPQLSTQYGYWPTYYVKEMINYAKANLQIDPNRIYVTGLSLGGGGVWRLITDTYNFDHTFDASIAAAAPVCGTQEETDADFCSTIGTNHLPVWAFHSMDDGTVGVGATQHAEILANMCGVTPKMKFTYYQSGGHVGAWLNAYDTGHITRTLSDGSSFTANPNLYEWFLSNTRSTTAPPANTPPTANAGSAQSITLPTSTVTLSGSGAGTNGATISSYSWTKTSGPSSGSISSPSAASTSVTGLSQGTYVFTLMVTDNHGLTATSTVNITVNAAAVNQSPVANAGSNTTITLPVSTVNLNGSGTDPDGSISSYAWTKTSGPSSGSISNAGAAATTATGLVQGSYVFTLKVTDNAGATASSSVTVTVNAAAVVANQYPSANAGANKTITLPSTLTLDASASYDPDGSIVKYRWTETSGPVGPLMTTRDSKTTDVTGLVAGTYIFILQVTDNGGLEASAAVTITVNAASTTTVQQNKLPVPTAGADKTITLPSGLTLDASGSYDPDGTIASYRWTETSGPVGPVMTTRDAMTTAVTGLVAGNYTFVLEVMDNTGAKAYAGVNITVNAAATAPTGNLLGYIKMSTGPYQACDDASSTGRIPLYGTSIANGAVVYSDAAMTKKYDGGWNWFSFTPTVGGKTTYAFAIYPIGTIGLLRNCATGTYLRTASATTAEQDIATLKSIKDSANGIVPATIPGKLTMYPNPVHSTATIQLNSADNGTKTVNVYNSAGVLQAKYSWQTVQGNNVYSLKNVSALGNGLYIVDIRDNSGKSIGSLKFLKM